MSSLYDAALRWDEKIVRKRGIPIIAPISETQFLIPTGYRLVAIFRGIDYLFGELFTDVSDVTHPLYYAEFFHQHQHRAERKEYRELRLFLLPEEMKPEDGQWGLIAA